MKTFVVNKKEQTRIPFLRGILTRSLLDAGLPFEDAFDLASRVRDGLGEGSEITSDEIRHRVKRLLEEEGHLGALEPYRLPVVAPARIQVNSLGGTTSAFSLAKIQERGALFSSPGEEVYENQIIGINAKAGDLKVNACKTKALTNMRSAGADEKSNVIPPMQLTLEDAVEYIQEGEFVEVTPDAVRMGKKPKPSRF